MRFWQVSRQTADAQVVTGNSTIYGVNFQETAGSTATVSLHDNTSATAGTMKWSRTLNASESDDAILNIPCETGIYLDITGAATVHVYYDERP